MFQFPQGPFPVLKSKRLILRHIAATDATAFFALRSNAEVMQHIPRPIMQHPDEAIAFIHLLQEVGKKEDGINWVITLLEDDIAIGNVCHFNFQKEFLRSEVGYMILPQFQNQGIMTEAVSLIVQYGFEKMGLHSCEAIINTKNIASQKVVEKVGFIQEGLFKESQIVHGEFADTKIYSILKQNFVPSS